MKYAFFLVFILFTGMVRAQIPADSVMSILAIEELPTYPGGMPAFYRYVGQNYKYPKEARENNVRGQILVAFVVEKNGSLTDFKILKDLGYGTGHELIRLLTSSPKWKPGKLGGQNVRVQYTLPVTLNLSTPTVPPGSKPGYGSNRTW